MEESSLLPPVILVLADENVQISRRTFQSFMIASTSDDDMFLTRTVLDSIAMGQRHIQTLLCIISNAEIYISHVLWDTSSIFWFATDFLSASINVSFDIWISANECMFRLFSFAMGSVLPCARFPHAPLPSRRCLFKLQQKLHQRESRSAVLLTDKNRGSTTEMRWRDAQSCSIAVVARCATNYCCRLRWIYNGLECNVHTLIDSWYKDIFSP